jgi:hypothetical protein
MLPGDAQVLEVDSGRHRFSIAYTLPPEIRVPLSLETTEGELIQDTDAHRLVIELLRAHDLSAITNDGRLRSTGSISLRQVTGFMVRANELQAKLEDVLTQINQSRVKSVNQGEM